MRASTEAIRNTATARDTRLEFPGQNEMPTWDDPPQAGPRSICVASEGSSSRRTVSTVVVSLYGGAGQVTGVQSSTVPSPRSAKTQQDCRQEEYEWTRPSIRQDMIPSPVYEWVASTFPTHPAGSPSHTVPHRLTPFHTVPHRPIRCHYLSPPSLDLLPPFLTSSPFSYIHPPSSTTVLYLTHIHVPWSSSCVL